MEKKITRIRGGKKPAVWTEVYLGMVIVLMVIGHAGRFGQYIYPFHMAALFFIAGYTQQREENALRVIWNRFYTRMLPYLSVFILMMLLFEGMDRLGLYASLFTEDALYYGFYDSFLGFFLHGKCMVWWMEAGWICAVLFGTEVIHAAVLALSGEDTRIYFIVTVILYLVGYYFVKEGYFFRIGLVENDLVFIAFGFFGAGYLFRQAGIFKKTAGRNSLESKACYAVFFVICTAVFCFFTVANAASVNYQKRSFNWPVSDFMMGISGSILLYAAAAFLARQRYIRQIFVSFSKNMQGIIFFHLLFFKAGYLILILLDIIPREEMRALYPSPAVGYTWWWLFAAVGILLSMMQWKILTLIPGLKFFLGKQERLWLRLYKKIKTLMRAAGVSVRGNLLEETGRAVREGLCRPWVLLGCGVTAMICLPLWNQGIMSNDELQYYYWSRQGLTTAYSYFRGAWISQGRFMASIFTPIWMWMSMLGKNIYEYRIIPVLSILLNIGLFGCLLNRLFKNRYFSWFCSLVLAAFVPVTFASMSPNAYTTSFGIPFSFLLWAMILYLDYIRQPGWKKGVLISLLMMIGFSSYEIFVTYVPLFCGFVLLKKGVKEISSVLKLCALPVMTGIVYIILYFLFQLWMPTIYDGNRIEFTLKTALSILGILTKISFPGAFLCSPVCRFLNEVNKTLRMIDYVRLGAVALGLLVLLNRMVVLGKAAEERKIKEQEKKGVFVDGCIAVTALVYTVLPILPIAISKQYQSCVGEGKGHIALPVTYFTFFAATFFCCFLAWKLLVRCRKLTIAVCLTIVIGLVCVPVQYMNANLSYVQNQYFSRIRHIEEFLLTDLLSGIPNLKIYSSDLFATRVSLAIHDTYWDMEMMRRGKDIRVFAYPGNAGEVTLDQENYFLSFVDDEYFVLEGGDVIYLAFPRGRDEVIVELFDGTLKKIQLDGCISQNGYYIYRVEKAKME